MRKLIFWRGTALALILMGALMLAHAVDVNGRVSGTVTDPSGAVLPNIQVTLTNEATNVKQVTTTQANGFYLFAQVPVGPYTVSVNAAGFKVSSIKGVVVQVDAQPVENFQLQVGSTTEQVEVSASSVSVDTTDMQLNNVVTNEQMVELPLISRTFTGLELIEPGVQNPSDRFGGNYSVSGAETQQSEYLINGADSADIALNSLAVSPNLDAIDQFNLIDGPLNAEYDRNSGGIVSATIKAGTNRFHGDVFEFYRDTFLNTLTFFQKSVTTGIGKVPPYHQHQFGATAGGPILHDKLFFFGAYQGIRQTVPDSNGSGASNVYNSANLAGNFSVEDNGAAGSGRPTGSGGWGVWTGIPIPTSISIPGCTTAGETWAQCAYDLGGVFPTSAFSQTAVNLVKKFVPAPNNGTYGYIFNPSDVTTDNQELGRIDFSPNASNTIYVLGIYEKAPTTQGLPFTGASLPGFGDVSTRTVQQYTGDYVHQFNASTVNDFSGHYTRFNFDAVEPQTVITPATYGFTTIHPQDAAAANIPTIGVSGSAVGFTLGFSTNGPQPRIDQVAQLDDSVSKVWGNHTLKFGYDGRRFNVHNPFYARNSGSYSFNNNGNLTSGDGGLDFLMGVPAGYNQNSGATIIADAFLNYVYAQDQWKLTPTFTLNYGMGYSIDTPLHNQQYGGNAIVCINKGENSTVFPGAPTGWVYGGDTGCTNAGKATTRYSEFGPRLGFAWAPSNLGFLSGSKPGEFSIRGGFGIYYDRTEEETALQTLATPPFGTSTGGASTNGLNPSFPDPFTDINGGGSVPNAFPYVFPKKGQKIDWAQQEANLGGAMFGVSTYGSDFRSPYAENIQLSIQREFPSQIVALISYVGSLGRHNQSTTDANPITPAGHAACVADPVCSSADHRVLQSAYYPSHTYLDNPLIWDVGQVGSGASSSYHSMQVSVQKGLTHGLTFQLSYTYAHAMDTGSSFENSGFGESSARGYNQFAPQLNVGDSAFDVRHRVVFSPIYVTPMLPGKSWYNPINLAISGWEISDITTAATGFPFDVSYAGGSSNSLWCPFYTNYYACPDAPNQVAAIVKGNPRIRDPKHGSSPYVSKMSWANEPIGSFGNTHRNPGHGPGLNNSNIVVAKNIYFSQDRGYRLQLRMETDNVFNHTQFTNPGTTWNDGVLKTAGSTFGYIGGTQAGRLSQLAMKFYF